MPPRTPVSGPKECLNLRLCTRSRAPRAGGTASRGVHRRGSIAGPNVAKEVKATSARPSAPRRRPQLALVLVAVLCMRLADRVDAEDGWCCRPVRALAHLRRVGRVGGHEPVHVVPPPWRTISSAHGRQPDRAAHRRSVWITCPRPRRGPWGRRVERVGVGRAHDHPDADAHHEVPGRASRSHRRRPEQGRAHERAADGHDSYPVVDPPDQRRDATDGRVSGSSVRPAWVGTEAEHALTHTRRTRWSPMSANSTQNSTNASPLKLWLRNSQPGI